MSTINWENIARSMGHPDAKAMWKKLYETQGLSVAQLAERFAVGRNTIREALGRAQIAMRTRGGPNSQKVVMDEKIASRCADEGTQQVANSLGVSYTTLHKQLKAFRKKAEPQPETTKTSEGLPPAATQPSSGQPEK